MAKTIKLGQLIRKTHIKFCDFDGDKNLEVLGVSNIEGITRTTHKKSADLSNYLVIKPNSFASILRTVFMCRGSLKSTG